MGRQKESEGQIYPRKIKELAISGRYVVDYRIEG